MKKILKGATVDTNKIIPGDILHMDFALYNVNPIQGFTLMLTLVCEKTIMLWIFHTTYKRYSVRIIQFTQTTLKNENNPCRHVLFYEDGTFEKSADVNNLLVE